jgi:hypothetical protein
LHDLRAVAGLVRFDGDLAALDQVELVRRFSFPKQHVAGFELDCSGALRQYGHMLGLHTVEKCVLGYGFVQGFDFSLHRNAAYGCHGNGASHGLFKDGCFLPADDQG